MSDALRPHGLQHARPPCPSPTPRVYSNSCPLSQWCHPTISLCHSLLLPPSIFPSIRVFSNEPVLCTRWPKYWSFSISISPSNEYSGLISFRIDWLDLYAVQGFLRVFSNTTVQKHKFFGTQLSLWYNSYIHTWLLRVGHEWATFTSHPYFTIGKTMTLILKLQVKILIYLLKYNCNI